VPSATFNAALREQKLLAVPAGDNVIRLIPALTVTDADIREALDRIRAGAATVSASLAVPAK
jgi:acetylornithine/N-succinyldiaminopimelate aminotransferase